MKQCERLKECPFKNDLSRNFEKYIQIQDFSEPISNAFEWANQQIIDMIFKNEDLLGRLRSIKSSFLFDKSDYFNPFIESAEQELSK